MKYSLVEIISKSQRNEFLQLPFKIYKGDHYWVPPLLLTERQRLNPKINPFLKYGTVKLFAIKNEAGDMVGRIASIINPKHMQIHNPDEGFFGLFECVNDIRAAEYLFKAVSDHLKQNGLMKIIGPVNFTNNDESGLLIEGFDSKPVFMTNYCKSYYPELLSKIGCKKMEDMYTYDWYRDHQLPSRFERIVDRLLQNKDFRIRSFNKKDYDNELHLVEEIYNKSFEGVSGFIPLSREEVNEMGAGFKIFADYDLILFAEYQGKPVGMCLTLPDLNQALSKMVGRLDLKGLIKFLYHKKRIKKVRLIVLGVLPEYRNSGITLLLVNRIIEIARSKGYTSGELSVVLETNHKMTGLLETLQFQPHKTYRLYSYEPE